MTTAGLELAGRTRYGFCAAVVRRVRTPWGTLASVEEQAVGAYDTAAGEQRVVLVHATGISRMVRSASSWRGPTVEGWELHGCGGGA